MSFSQHYSSYLNKVINDSSQSWSNKFRALLSLAQVQTLQRRKEIVETLVDLYEGRQQDHLEDTIWKTYSDTKNIEKVKEWYNITKLFIDKLSVVYDSQASRELTMIGGKEPNQKELDLFEEIKKTVFWQTFFQKINKYTTLCSECIVRVFWYEPKQEIRLQIVTPDLIDIIPNSMCPTELEGVIYHEIIKDPFAYTQSRNNSIEERWFLWTDERYAITRRSSTSRYLLGELYEPVYQDNNDEAVNPYGILPFVISRSSIPKDFILSEAGEDIINIQDGINRIVLQINELCLTQSFAIPVVRGWSSADGTINISPGIPLVLPEKDPSMETQPDFNYVTPESKIMELFNIFKEKIMAFAQIYGVSPSDFQVSGTPSSGYALRLQNRELEKRFTREKPFYETLEANVFEVVKRIWNYESRKPEFGKNSKSRLAKFKGVTFSDNTVLTVSCNAPQYPEDPSNVERAWQYRFDNKLATPVDYLVTEDGLNEEEALKKYEKNKEFFDKYNPPPRNPFEDEGDNIAIGKDKKDGREEILQEIEKQEEEEDNEA